MSPWRHKHIHPRPILLGRSNYRKWDITPPSALAGSGLETVQSGFVAIPDPKPVGVQLFALPNMALDTDGGGALAAAVQFWGAGDNEEDDNGLLSEAALALLSAVQAPVSWVDYGLAEASVNITGSGSFTGDWVSVSEIPAGSGYLIGGSTGGGASASAGPPFGIGDSWSAAITCGIELGDVSGAVVASVTQMASLAASKGGTITAKGLCARVVPLSWASAIRKVRAVATATMTGDAVGGAGINAYCGIRRMV